MRLIFRAVFRRGFLASSLTLVFVPLWALAWLGKGSGWVGVVAGVWAGSGSGPGCRHSALCFGGESVG